MHLPAAALTRLRERFAALCTPQNNASENAHVKKILMVGAVLENNELGNSDRIWLSIAMRRLHKLQIPVDPGFEIETLNLKNTPPEDFLESAPAADMVIICFIPYDIPRMKVSPHHHEPDI